MISIKLSTGAAVPVIASQVPRRKADAMPDATKAWPRAAEIRDLLPWHRICVNRRRDSVTHRGRLDATMIAA